MKKSGEVFGEPCRIFCYSETQKNVILWLPDVAPYPMPYLLYLILKIQKHFLLALSELRLLYLPHLHWYREFP